MKLYQLMILEEDLWKPKCMKTRLIADNVSPGYLKSRSSSVIESDGYKKILVLNNFLINRLFLLCHFSFRGHYCNKISKPQWNLAYKWLQSKVCFQVKLPTAWQSHAMSISPPTCFLFLHWMLNTFSLRTKIYFVIVAWIISWLSVFLLLK